MKRVLIWGIAGASLGLEIAKSLQISKNYSVYGIDKDKNAFGHFSDLFVKTFVFKSNSFIDELIGFCKDNGIDFLVPGGDAVNSLVFKNFEVLTNSGVTPVGNSPEIVRLCSDKFIVFERLASTGLKIPTTILLENAIEHQLNFPVIGKPRLESGGSRGVVYISNKLMLNKYYQQNFEFRDRIVIQEYIDAGFGELTIGVLSNTNHTPAGAILLKRDFSSRLSVHENSSDFLISSGSSQGEFFFDESINQQALTFARVLGSTGPLNIQCRIAHDLIIPFEFNPRFSASTYLRTLAGVNEVALYLDHLQTMKPISYPRYARGIVRRGFTEKFIEISSDEE